jgi:hypothetical protein
MNETQPCRGLQVLTGITGLIGPAGAILYETGRFRFFPSELLYDVWLLAIIAALGTGIGIVSCFRGAKIIGMACFFSNCAVLILYGFIAAFFTFGGSR